MQLVQYFRRAATPSLAWSLTPIVLLLAAITTMLIVVGPDSIQDYSYILLLGAAGIGAVIALALTHKKLVDLYAGVRKSASQILPAVPILLLIGTLSATWMLSGVVPTLIDYGLMWLNPTVFLVMACAVCAVVSVVTGSSWTTIATIGVAFMGIGTVMGYSPAWVAGAIISGAYFGDKVSPLSDTTVLAASSCDVGLFAHIRFLMMTTVPAMTIALIVYAIVGFVTPTIGESGASDMIGRLADTFNITPWTMVIPAITCVMIVMRCSTVMTLAVSSLAGLIGMFVFQPDIVAGFTDESSLWATLKTCVNVLCTSTSVATGDPALDDLVATGGVAGMLPTVYLVLSAMVFGGILIGSGMLGVVTQAITSRLHSPRHLVSTTVASGLFLNGCTGDQYLSIIIGGNVYRSTYQRLGLKPQVLSRSLEDSVSVTSVLIPWNSCGVTQSTVLGVATLAYLPCCIFNILSPIMSIVMAWVGWRLKITQVPVNQLA